MASARYIIAAVAAVAAAGKRKWNETPGSNAFVKTPKRLFRWRLSRLDSAEARSDKVTNACVAEGYDL